MLASLLAAALLASFAAPFQAGEKIRVTGSETLLLLDRELAVEYRRFEPTARVVVTGGGSEVGIRALLDGTTDVAASSRPLEASERAAFALKHGHEPEEQVVALSGLALYVNQSNPLSTLTVTQIARILSGEVRNWRELGWRDEPIQVFTRDRNSGTRDFLQEHVLGMNVPFTGGAIELPNVGTLIEAVTSQPGGFGYGPLVYAKEAHIVRVAERPGTTGVAPTPEDVASGRYALSRNLYYYVDPENPNPALQPFLEWVRGPYGRSVIRESGIFLPPRVGETAAAPVAAHALTRENMAEHGLDFAVVLRDGLAALAGRTDVTIRFASSARALERVNAVTLAMGEEAQIPLVLDADRSLHFEMRRELIPRCVVTLSTGGVSSEAVAFQIPLASFCSVD